MKRLLTAAAFFGGEQSGGEGRQSQQGAASWQRKQSGVSPWWVPVTAADGQTTDGGSRLQLYRLAGELQVPATPGDGAQRKRRRCLWPRTPSADGGHPGQDRSSLRVRGDGQGGSQSARGSSHAGRALSRICKLRPDVVLCYTMKPIIYGLGIAARLAGVDERHALVTGLGYTFSDHSAILASA